MENCLGNGAADKVALLRQPDGFLQGMGQRGNGGVLVGSVHVVVQLFAVLDASHAGTQQHLKCDVRVAVRISGAELNGAVSARRIQQLYQRNPVLF